jgi:hypothetical protein
VFVFVIFVCDVYWIRHVSVPFAVFVVLFSKGTVCYVAWLINGKAVSAYNGRRG